MFRDYVEAHDNGRFLMGVTIGGIDVSGRTLEEAQELLHDHLERLSDTALNIVLSDRVSLALDPSDINLRFFNPQEILEQALALGVEGSLARRFQTIRAVRNGRVENDFPLALTFDQGVVHERIAEAFTEHLHTPRNASVTVVNGEVHAVPQVRGETIDFEATIAAIIDAFAAANQESQSEARIVSLVVHEEDAIITDAQMTEITDVLGSFTTSFAGSVANRAINIENGARLLSNILLQPGESLSVGTTMGPYTIENGYASGASFEGNFVTESIGGGVCQVSSTIYNALLYAELEILVRNAHSMMVSYVPPSQDAAIAEGLLDLVFRNNQASPIYILSMIDENQSLTYHILGREIRPSNRRIVLENVHEVQEGSLPTQFVAIDAPLGTWRLMNPSKNAIHARLYRHIYVDDVRMESQRVNFSYYVAAPRTYGIGTTHADPTVTNALREAIRSQEESHIRVAIDALQNGRSVPVEGEDAISTVEGEVEPEDRENAVDEVEETSL